MSDELLTAADVAQRVEILARRGRIPIAPRGPGRTLKFSDRAVSSMLAYERGRDGGE